MTPKEFIETMERVGVSRKQLEALKGGFSQDLEELLTITTRVMRMPSASMILGGLGVFKESKEGLVFWIKKQEALDALEVSNSVKPTVN